MEICGYKVKKVLCKGGTLEEAARSVVNSLHEYDRLNEQAIQQSYQIPNIHGIDTQAIFSMASVTFFHLDIIKNLRKLILENYRLNNISVSWDYDREPPVDSGYQGSTGKLLSWKTYFDGDNGEKEVIFEESLDHTLQVKVNNVSIIKLRDGARLELAHYQSLIKALEV